MQWKLELRNCTSKVSLKGQIAILTVICHVLNGISAGSFDILSLIFHPCRLTLTPHTAGVDRSSLLGLSMGRVRKFFRPTTLLITVLMFSTVMSAVLFARSMR